MIVDEIVDFGARLATCSFTSFQLHNNLAGTRHSHAFGRIETFHLKEHLDVNLVVKVYLINIFVPILLSVVPIALAGDFTVDNITILLLNVPL